MVASKCFLEWCVPQIVKAEWAVGGLMRRVCSLLLRKMRIPIPWETACGDGPARDVDFGVRVDFTTCKNDFL